MPGNRPSPFDRRALARAPRRRLLQAAVTAALGAEMWPARTLAQAPMPAPLPGKANEAPLPALGDAIPVPAEPIALLDGSSLGPQKLRDSLLVLYWWASWCPFCAVQSPHIDALWRRHREQGLFVLGLSIDTHAEDARTYLQRKGYGFPSAWRRPDLDRTWPKPRGLPVVVVRGRNGRVLMAEAGQLFAEDVAEIARLL